jgi:autotransporter-associated beta strand protein
MNATSSGTTAGGITVQNGAAVELANNITIGGEPINSLVGTGVANGGALRNIANNSSTYGGAITLGEGGARINSDSGGTLILTGGVVTGSSAGVVSGSPFSSTADLTIGGAGNTTVSSTAIIGYGRLTKDGAGTLTLSAANTYIGATTVSNGTLAITSTGSINPTSAVLIGAAEFNYSSNTALSNSVTFTGVDGVLSGSGTIIPAVTVTSGNALSPGTGVGSLSFSNGVAIASGGIFNWENNLANDMGSAGTNWDVVNVTAGSTAISSTPGTGSKLKLQFTNALTSFSEAFWDTNKTWNIITGGASVGNLFDTSNIAIFIDAVQQGLDNIISGRGAFSTAIVGNDVQLQWTAGNGTAPEIKVEQGTEILNNGSKDFGTVVVGASASLTFTISNIGDADLTDLTITKSGTHAGDFSMTQVSPAAPVSGSTGTTTFTVTFSPLATGARTAAIHIASNDADENPFTIIVTGDGTTAYDQWALSKNLIGLAGSDADPDFYADPDKDGIKNGLEWVLGGNPKQNDSPSVLPAVNVTGGSLIQTFKRAEASINETALIIEYGTNLVTWPKSVTVGANTAPADGNGVVVTVNAGLTPDEVIVNIPASGNAVGGKLFARMHLTRLPVP